MATGFEVKKEKMDASFLRLRFDSFKNEYNMCKYKRKHIMLVFYNLNMFKCKKKYQDGLAGTHT